MSIPEAIRGALARIHDPHSSHEAADSLADSHLFSSQEEVWFLLASFGPLADHELVARHEEQVATLAYPRRFQPQRLRTARNELYRQGRVVKTGKRALTPSGRHAIIWALTEEKSNG
jgi:hypothetical protein